MSPENVLTTLRWLLTENLLLQRLFFASVELAGLALVVVLTMRLARIRSPRLISLLWLVVLIKPIVSLTAGSPLPVVLLDQAEAEVAANASAPPAALFAPWDENQKGWGEPIAAADARWEISDEPTSPASGSPAVAEAAQSVSMQELASRWLPPAITLAWIAGGLLFLLHHLVNRLRVHAVVAAAGVPSESVRSRYRKIGSEFGLKRVPRLLVTDALDSPALVGLVRPVILVPSWLAGDANDEKLDWSLRHELSHWKWLDPLALLVRDVSTILFYFHPVTWWAGRRQLEAMELACDQALLHTDSDATNYAEQLYQILRNMRHRRRVAVAGGLFATRTQVGKRIAALLESTVASRPQLTVCSVLGVLLLAAGALAVGGGVRSDEAAEPSGKTTGNERVLRFPRTRKLGFLSVRQSQPLRFQDWQNRWEWLGRAQGTVRVPAGKDVWLQVTPDGSQSLRGLSGLAPDDIQVITIEGTPPDAVMAHLAKLTGLKLLVFYKGLPRGADCDHISRLKSLEALIVGRSEITDGELRSLVSRLEDLKSFRWLEIGSTQLTDAGLAHLQGLRSLEVLDFGSDNLAGHGMAHLADLPRLQKLRFGSLSMGDRGLEHLTQCTSLKHLALYCPKIPDAGIAYLGKLKSLESLNLRFWPIGDAALAHLSQLPSLRELNLRDTKVTDAGLAHLSKLTSLENLTLPEGTTDAGLAQLRDLTGLKYLWLGATGYSGLGLESLRNMKSLEYLRPPGEITDDDLATIGAMPLLKELWVNSYSVSNDGLSHLKSLKSLEILKLYAGNVTGSGLAHLRGLPLKRLNLGLGRLDESRLTHLAGLSELEQLNLGELSLEDDDLASVGKLTGLKILGIRSKTLSDAGMAHLANLTSLERLSLTPCLLTEDGLSHLVKLPKLAHVQIHADFSNTGFQQLAKLKSLRTLILWTNNEPNPAAVRRLKSRMPGLHWMQIRKRPPMLQL